MFRCITYGDGLTFVLLLIRDECLTLRFGLLLSHASLLVTARRNLGERDNKVLLRPTQLDWVSWNNVIVDEGWLKMRNNWRELQYALWFLVRGTFGISLG